MLAVEEEDILWNSKVEYEPVFQLGSSFMESISLMKQVDELQKKFPGLDCGCCGAPSCRALAEDIVRGVATENACIHILKDRLHLLSRYAREFANNEVVTEENVKEYIDTARQYINKMSMDIAKLDDTIGVKPQPEQKTPLKEDLEEESGS